jgi:hypothetical protein
MISQPEAWRFSYSRRNPPASFVQPAVKALGKKNTTAARSSRIW